MDVHRLIKMANEIGAFFEAEPDRAVALEGVATHVQRFWEPRMRRELLRWVDEHDGQGLTELVLAAIQANREKLTPQTTASP
jgi:formate dehydrogenase subunit delta